MVVINIRKRILFILVLFASFIVVNLGVTPASALPQYVERILDKANRGDDMAQLAIGNMYLRGQGVPQDYSKAAMWLEKSAEQGNVKAQYYI